MPRRKKLDKVTSLVNEINERTHQLNELLADYWVHMPDTMVFVPVGFRTLAKKYGAEVSCSPRNDATGYFDATFTVNGAKFVEFCIPEAEREDYEVRS